MFVRGLARGFGSKDMVTSPTFTINKIYKNDVSQEIHHFDFYRLGEPGVLVSQLAESLHNRNAVTVVEWGKMADEVMPKDMITIKLEPTPASENERKIEVHYPEDQTQVMKQLETEWAASRP